MLTAKPSLRCGRLKVPALPCPPRRALETRAQKRFESALSAPGLWIAADLSSCIAPADEPPVLRSPGNPEKAMETAGKSRFAPGNGMGLKSREPRDMEVPSISAGCEMPVAFFCFAELREGVSQRQIFAPKLLKSLARRQFCAGLSRRLEVSTDRSPEGPVSAATISANADC